MSATSVVNLFRRLVINVKKKCTTNIICGGRRQGGKHIYSYIYIYSCTFYSDKYNILLPKPVVLRVLLFYMCTVLLDACVYMHAHLINIIYVPKF